MRTLILRYTLAFLSANCFSCVHSRTQGNFTTHTSQDIQRQVATHAAGLILDQNPPAQTILRFTHPIRDPFGRKLSDELTKAGYGIVHSSGAHSQTDLTVSYVLDEVEQGILRLSLLVENTEYSQAYVIDADSSIRSGAWSKTTRTQTPTEESSKQ